MMEVPQNPGCDFLDELSGRDLYHVIDMIFQYLDGDAVRAAETVSTDWKQVIAKGSYWEKQLQKKVRESQDWRDMLSYVKTVKPDLLLGQDGNRRAYYLTAEYLKKQEINWKKGNWVAKKCYPNSPPCLVLGPRQTWNRDLFPTLINQSFSMNTKLIATAGGNSKITIRNRFNLNEIKNVLEIPETISLPFLRDAPRRPLINSVKVSELLIVACFYYHTEVCVWDATSHDLIGVLDGNLFPADFVPLQNPWHFVCLHENTIGTIHGGGAEIMLSLYKVSSEPDRKVSVLFQDGIFKEENDIQTVLDAYIDHDMIIMMLECERGDSIIEIHYISSKAATRFDLRALSSLKPFRFHYHGGYICIGAQKFITLIDVKAGPRHILKMIPIDGIAYDVKLIKDKYLVICGCSGHLIILDLKKALDPLALVAQDFNLFRIESFPFCLNVFRHSVPRPSLQVVDDHQIGLAIQFPGKDYSLFTFDFIGDWDMGEGGRNPPQDSLNPYGII